ncbi:hypothetical protein [Yinghuangia soli]|uniref:Uncharacterized protein n=1 Tax=Yinghuangia soli TaxID=2908204 RepID=A0AA41PXE6_9ACTN|nr:hypothetical protein [Yinghuangia soli]MCF2526599.1 hypothetical protein [Yinghuangia soli]
MTAGEVGEALDCPSATSSRSQLRSQEAIAEQFHHIGVTAYYSGDGRLACVAVDASDGPQVTLDGVSLVGCVPSELTDWICDHTEAQGLELSWTHEGNASVRDLGLIMRVQRAGDVVLSRPLFMIHEWAMGVWEHVPDTEWRTF